MKNIKEERKRKERDQDRKRGKEGKRELRRSLAPTAALAIPLVGATGAKGDAGWTEPALGEGNLEIDAFDVKLQDGRGEKSGGMETQ